MRGALCDSCLPVGMARHCESSSLIACVLVSSGMTLLALESCVLRIDWGHRHASWCTSRLVACMYVCNTHHPFGTCNCYSTHTHTCPPWALHLLALFCLSWLPDWQHDSSLLSSASSALCTVCAWASVHAVHVCMWQV